MKKLAFVFAFVFLGGIFVQAQDLVSKKGFTILPEAGDYAIGFNAVPFFDFMLNAADIMTNAGATTQHPGYVSGFNNVLVGKYFLEDNLAIRGKLGINTNTTTNKLYFDNPKDVFENPTDQTKWNEISDVTKTSNNNILLGGGLEFRRGHNRLQGFYGGEALLGFQSAKVTKDFGVEMTEQAITNGFTNGDGSALSGRVLTNKAGTSISFGVRGFAGVEYFFAPKISVAGEFGWGLGIATTPRGKTEVENWDATNKKVETKENEGPTKGSAIKFAVDNGIGQTLGASAALNLIFHF